jgi:hypothetical protein
MWHLLYEAHSAMHEYRMVMNYKIGNRPELVQNTNPKFFSGNRVQLCSQFLNVFTLSFPCDALVIHAILFSQQLLSSTEFIAQFDYRKLSIHIWRLTYTSYVNTESVGNINSAVAAVEQTERWTNKIVAGWF